MSDARRGRPRVHEDDAAKQRAYAARRMERAKKDHERAHWINELAHRIAARAICAHIAEGRALSEDQTENAEIAARMLALAVELDPMVKI